MSKPTSFQEYPKALYKGGDYISVADPLEEQAQRKEGFLDWRADFDRLMGPVDESTTDTSDEARPEPLPKRAPLTLKK